MLELIRSLIANLGYVVLIAFFVTNLGVFMRAVQKGETNFQEKLLLALIFGAFGILSTYLGIRVHGSIASTRIIGVMAGGMLCGPFVGIAAGLVSGLHRFFYDLGGTTSLPCSVMTLIAGFASALVYKTVPKDRRWLAGLIAGFVLESLEMGLVLLLARPFERALAIVNSIYLPMSLTNSLGICVLVLIITNTFREKEVIAARQAKAALEIARRTLPLLRDMSSESLASACAVICEATGAIAVAITDRNRLIAHAGEGEGCSPEGDAPASAAIRRVLDTGLALRLRSQAEIWGARGGGSCSSAVLAPLRDATGITGSLALFFRRDEGLSYSNEPLVEELSLLISTQLELSKVGALRELASKSELKALQAQINPHFLFNALNTITAFLRSDPARARELIVSLSTYLRYNIEQLATLVDIMKELEQVRAYVEIERARFGDELKVVYNIDEHLKARLPSLVIQPLVENAIKHGILKGRGSGTVLIDVRRQGPNQVRVSVEDDGVGIPQAIIEGLRNGSHCGRVGLNNVNSRLLIVYNRGLEIQRLLRGTRVEFVVEEMAG